MGSVIGVPISIPFRRRRGLIPNKEECLQAVILGVATLNDNGYYEFVDKIGKLDEKSMHGQTTKNNFVEKQPEVTPEEPEEEVTPEEPEDNDEVIKELIE